jgi:dihydroflavonol-4-reductase
MPQRTAYCWAHVDDVARGHVLAMERGRVGESYFVCGPVHTLIEALRLAEQFTGVPTPALTAPPWVESDERGDGPGRASSVRPRQL